MTTPTTTNMLVELKALDAAPDARDDARAAELLARVLATEPAPAGLRLRAPRRTRRIAIAAVAVAAVTTALIVVPSMVGDGGKAMAGWTAMPEVMSASAAAQAAAECREMFTDPAPSGPNWPADAAAQINAAIAVLTERRGPWKTVLLVGDRGVRADCVMGSGGASGSVSWDPLPPAPAADDVTVVGAGYSYFAHEGDFSTLNGLAGVDVTGVTLHSKDHGLVTGTVENGYFSIWVPGDEWGTDYPQQGLPVTVTLASGASHLSHLVFEDLPEN